MTVPMIYTAYGEHKCDLCSEPIRQGQQYLRETTRTKGEMFRVHRQHYPLCSEKTRGQ